MRCKFCGGEVNLSVGRCISCGRGTDDTSDIRILRDFGSIAEQYGLDPDLEKYDEPIQYSEEVQPLEQRTSAAALPPDLDEAKKPGIQLNTYYELLGDNSSESESDSSEELSSENPNDIADGDKTDKVSDVTSPANGLFVRLEQWLDKLDELTSPITERLRQWYNAKMPQMNRAQSSSKWERLILMGILAAAAVVIVAIISAIISSIPASISGEWQVSDDGAKSLFTVEFSHGEVTARVYDESGEAHIYKKGTYDVSRSNGRDLLTIVYEDGNISHLYYEISGRTGEFINVDTGSSDSYQRVD